MQLLKSVFNFCVLNYVSSLVFLGDSSCDSGLSGQPVSGQSVSSSTSSCGASVFCAFAGEHSQAFSFTAWFGVSYLRSFWYRQFSRSLSLRSFPLILLAYLVLMETGPCLQLQNSWLPHVLSLLYWQDSWCGFHLSSLVKPVAPDC